MSVTPHPSGEVGGRGSPEASKRLTVSKWTVEPNSLGCSQISTRELWHVCSHIHMNVSTCTCVYKHRVTHTHRETHTNTDTQTHTYTHKHRHTHVDTNTHTHIH